MENEGRKWEEDRELYVQNDECGTKHGIFQHDWKVEVSITEKQNMSPKRISQTSSNTKL